VVEPAQERTPSVVRNCSPVQAEQRREDERLEHGGVDRAARPAGTPGMPSIAADGSAQLGDHRRLLGSRARPRTRSCRSGTSFKLGLDHGGRVPAGSSRMLNAWLKPAVDVAVAHHHAVGRVDRQPLVAQVAQAHQDEVVGPVALRFAVRSLRSSR
jgi:hypothetical protein